MSVRIMSKIFEMEDMAPTPRLILLALADHADDEGNCYPSISRLCRRTGLSERALQTNLARLQEDGFVTVSKNAGPKGCNRYRVTPTPRGTCTPAADAPPQEMRPARDAPPQQMRLTPAADAPLPPQEMHPNHQEPSGNRQKADHANGVAFSAFWSEWPNKVKKQDAEKAWRKLKPADREAAHRCQGSWWKSWRRQNPQAAPIHAASFLNQRRWEDDFSSLLKPHANTDPDIARWRRMG